MISSTGDVAHCLNAGGMGRIDYETETMIADLDPAVSKTTNPKTVRRLTPVECARLQGFPDDHCFVTHQGKPATDAQQYKALGNSMAVPVVRWIIGRIRDFQKGIG
jgi:DNA (cytosine-5)-methyltransferase 1